MKITNTEWMQESACLGVDPALFFADDDGHLNEEGAKAICAGCPVQLQCLDYSITNREDDVPSVWAGMNDRERRKLRFRWVRTFPDLVKSLDREVNEMVGLEADLDVLGV